MKFVVDDVDDDDDDVKCMGVSNYRGGERS